MTISGTTVQLPTTPDCYALFLSREQLAVIQPHAESELIWLQGQAEIGDVRTAMETWTHILDACRLAGLETQEQVPGQEDQ